MLAVLAESMLLLLLLLRWQPDLLQLKLSGTEEVLKTVLHDRYD